MFEQTSYSKVKFIVCKNCRIKFYQYPSATELLATQYRPANIYTHLCVDCNNPK